MSGLFLHRILFCLAFLFMVPTSFAATPDEDVWTQLKETYFGDRVIEENADDMLLLEAPKRAEDAAIVPISIKSLHPQTPDNYIAHLYIIIDKNPMPYSADFTLSPELETVDISTRMRIDQYTYVRAIAEMNDGSLHMVKRFVKASGGCSAPATKDAAAALARLGKMQMRMRQPEIGTPLQAQMIISHPNYNGLQYDQKNRKYIPAHYVQNIDIRFNDKSLMKVEAGISLSEDPSIRFVFTPEQHGTLSAIVTDSKQQSYEIEEQI